MNKLSSEDISSKKEVDKNDSNVWAGLWDLRARAKKIGAPNKFFSMLCPCFYVPYLLFCNI